MLQALSLDLWDHVFVPAAADQHGQGHPRADDVNQDGSYLLDELPELTDVCNAQTEAKLR